MDRIIEIPRSESYYEDEKPIKMHNQGFAQLLVRMSRVNAFLDKIESNKKLRLFAGLPSLLNSARDEFLSFCHYVDVQGVIFNPHYRDISLNYTTAFSKEVKEIERVIGRRFVA